MKRYFSEFTYIPEARKALKDAFQDREKLKRFIGFLNDVSDPKDVINKLLTRFHVIALGGHATHFFITEPGLAELMVEMVKDVPANVLDVFQETRLSTAVIHPLSPLPAVMLGIATTELDHTIAIISENCKDPNCYTPKAFSQKIFIRPTAWGDRLAIGLALYMRFFPNAIKDGLPDFAKHPSHYKGKTCQSIGVCQEFKKFFERNGPRPHLRVGHFRFLTAECFKESRFKQILVRPASVKGKCKVVIYPDDGIEPEN